MLCSGGGGGEEGGELPGHFFASFYSTKMEFCQAQRCSLLPLPKGESHSQLLQTPQAKRFPQISRWAVPNRISGNVTPSACCWLTGGGTVLEKAPPPPPPLLKGWEGSFLWERQCCSAEAISVSYHKQIREKDGSKGNFKNT